LKNIRLLLIGLLVIFLFQIINGNALSERVTDSGSVTYENYQNKVEETETHAAEGGHDILHKLTVLMMQLFIILLAAKIGGEICVRYLRQPSVLGELIMGMLIGPYALGQYFNIPLLGQIFSLPTDGSTIPVSVELYSVAQIAVIILLFIAGLETDFKQFMKYAFPATVIAIGGVVFPFFFGAWATTVFHPGVTSLFEIEALFMGAIMTATSVGITARVLTDIGKLNTPEGVTILAGAVVDDVLGILILAIVVGLAKSGGVVSGSEVAVISIKAIGVWLGIMIISLILAKKIEKMLNWFKSDGAVITIAMSLCFLASAIAEMFGLAMIIGAYAFGLAMSTTEISKKLIHMLEGVNHLLVPVFFVVMGMLVDFGAMSEAVLFGIVVSVLAIIGKVFGCGIPALGVGFNMRGGWRVGVGMLPRGEVALIVAGVGLASRAIHLDIFGVSVMMTMVTTLLAPIFLVPLFRTGGPGTKKETIQN